MQGFSLHLQSEWLDSEVSVQRASQPVLHLHIILVSRLYWSTVNGTQIG